MIWDPRVDLNRRKTEIRYDIDCISAKMLQFLNLCGHLDSKADLLNLGLVHHE